ncbi:short-chain dehydrogenase [Sinomonas atrocyanea]|uniref:Short-chain dehydrogenase n=2 Tax=Sinomonas atrocyanea TaxID=37927 RepID=A0A126ZXU3_9MICC|nr:short-chain dehydrogenase [Sinomonas atrocyanea]GEB64470.1 short-chain dehydrogenase [Sinomonas atrocyanea]GGG62645.1 short-chain dehydrogenase [Sinomonas atrocyanea]
MTTMSTSTSPEVEQSTQEPLRGARILVTGGASGLGAAIVDAAAAQGARPIVVDRQPAPEGVTGVVADLSVREEAEAAVARAAEEAGGLDAVVCAAGIDRCGELTEVAADEWERVLRVNLIGTAAVVRAALPHLLESHGRVVTVASTLGLRGAAGATAYCASKFGVIGFSRALAAELKGRVGVTTLIPGGMDTAFFDDRPEDYKPHDRSTLNRPSDVARSVLFALSQPRGCEIRELLVAGSMEDSWP